MEIKISILDVWAEWLSWKILPKWQTGIWSSSLWFPYPVSLRVQSIQMGSGRSPVGGFHHPSLEVAHKVIRNHSSLVNHSHMDVCNYKEAGKCSLTMCPGGKEIWLEEQPASFCCGRREWFSFSFFFFWDWFSNLFEWLFFLACS